MNCPFCSLNDETFLDHQEGCPNNFSAESRKIAIAIYNAGIRSGDKSKNEREDCRNPQFRLAWNLGFSRAVLGKPIAFDA